MSAELSLMRVMQELHSLFYKNVDVVPYPALRFAVRVIGDKTDSTCEVQISDSSNGISINGRTRLHTLDIDTETSGISIRDVFLLSALVSHFKSKILLAYYKSAEERKSTIQKNMDKHTALIDQLMEEYGAMIISEELGSDEKETENQ